MSAVRQVGIKMVVDAQSVTTELPKAAREFVNLGAAADQGAARATRSLAQVSMSVRDIVQGAAGLHLVGKGIEAISNTLTSLPRQAFDFSKNLEVSQVGMAGILGSMTAINGQQLDYNRALQISSEYIKKLNDDALRTAATSQELVQVFQALLAPGLGAKMTLEEIRQLTVVGTNAVKSMGLDAGQVVQELRDLVAGGITPASSTLASALGLKDSDIAKAKASSEGLFKFLMDRLQGFQASSDAFGDTFKGKLDQVQEGATRVAAEGLGPLITASKAALGEISSLFVTIDENKNVTINQGLVDNLKAMSQAAVTGMGALRDLGAQVYEHREAVMLLASAYLGMKLGSFVADMAQATAAKVEAAQASRLAAVQAAAEAAGNVEVATTSRQKVAAYLAELSAKAASAQADVAAQAAQLATLNTTREAIVVARAEVVAKMDAVRATMAQAEAQIAAARAAGAQSVALALVRDGTQALTAAQARHAVLLTELATLGKQQAGVQAAIAAATTAQTAAQNAAAASAAQLAAAQGAASVAGRALGGVLSLAGGWVGLLTTAVTVGVTAWTLWGNAGSDAERKVQGSVARSTPEIVADLDKQIAKLNQRNALAGAGMGELAKQGGEAAERMGELQQVIDKLRAQKGSNQTEEVRRLDDIRKAQAEYGQLQQRVNMAAEAQERLNKGSGQLTLTATGAEQAWRKSIDGVKTATAIQQEYNDKLQASRDAFKAYSVQLESGPNASPEKFHKAQAEQDQVEKSLAQERDKKIKELGAGAATARAQGIDAEIAATKHGYKLLAAQTADSLAEVEAQRNRGALSDSDALEKRTVLQLADIDAQRAAVESELALLHGRKDSAKKQADMLGELAELAQKRTNIEAQAARDQRAIDERAAADLDARVEKQQAAARAAQEQVIDAQAVGKAIGLTGAALGEFNQRQLEDSIPTALKVAAGWANEAGQLGELGKAARDQIQALKDLAKVQGYNESARMVHDYAKAIDEANAATQYELSLTGMSQREREIALEQYRIAIDLKKRLEEIDAKNPADKAGAEKLKADATEAAARAQAGVAGRVYAREMTRTVDQIDDIFRQGFADMLNRGEDGWKAFTKSLATTFKTTVANELYKTFAQRFVVNIVANLVGFLGLGGSGNAVGLGSGGGGLMGMASNASSLYSLASGNSMLGSAASTVGGWMGLGSAATGLGITAGSAGAGAIGAGIGGYTAAAGTGMGLTMGGAGLGLTAGSAGAGAIGAGIGTSAAAGGAAAGGASLTSALAAIPGWGWVAAGVVAVLGSVLSRTTEKRGAGLMGTLGQDGGVHDLDLMRKGGSLFGGPKWFVEDRGVSAMDKALQDSYSAQRDSLMKMGDALGLATDGVKDFTVTLGSDQLGDGKVRGLRLDGLSDQEAQAKITAAMAEASNEIAQQIIGSWVDVQKPSTNFADVAAGNTTQTVKEYVPSEFAREGEQAIDTLTRLATSISSVNNSFETLGVTLYEASLAGGDLASGLIDAMGGMEQFQSTLQGYYQSYYSQTEQLSNAARTMGKGFDELGVAMPRSRQELRGMITTALEAGESGQKLAADLLSASANFDSFAASLMSLSGLTTDSIKGIFSTILEEAGSAQEAEQMATDAFGTMIMDSMQNAMLSGLSDMVMNSLVAPMMESMLAGAVTGSTALASGGATAAVAMAQGGAYAGSANAGGGAAAAESMAQGGASAGASMASGGAAAGGVVGSFLDHAKVYLGNFTAVMSDPEIQAAMAELGKTFGSTAGSLYSFSGGGGGGAKSFNGGGGGGGGGGGKEADKLADSMKKLGEVIGDEISRLRGVNLETSAYAKDVLLARFATTTAQARAGDKDALDKLTGLSKSIEDATKLTAISAIEDVRMRAWLADSLEQTLKAIGQPVPAFASGGMHAGGLRLVGERGWEVEATGPARIWNQQQLGQALGGGSADLVAEVRALRALVAQLLPAAQATASHTSVLPGMADQFDNATFGGNAMRVEVMNTVSMEVSAP